MRVVYGRLCVTPLRLSRFGQAQHSASAAARGFAVSARAITGDTAGRTSDGQAREKLRGDFEAEKRENRNSALLYALALAVVVGSASYVRRSRSLDNADDAATDRYRPGVIGRYLVPATLQSFIRNQYSFNSDVRKALRRALWYEYTQSTPARAVHHYKEAFGSEPNPDTRAGIAVKISDLVLGEEKMKWLSTAFERAEAWDLKMRCAVLMADAQETAGDPGSVKTLEYVLQGLLLPEERRPQWIRSTAKRSTKLESLDDPVSHGYELMSLSDLNTKAKGDGERGLLVAVIQRLVPYYSGRKSQSLIPLQIVMLNSLDRKTQHCEVAETMIGVADSWHSTGDLVEASNWLTTALATLARGRLRDPNLQVGEGTFKSKAFWRAKCRCPECECAAMVNLARVGQAIHAEAQSRKGSAGSPPAIDSDFWAKSALRVAREESLLECRREALRLTNAT